MRCSDLRTNEQKFGGVNYNSSTYTSQPTYSQSFRWFREKYDIHSYIEVFSDNTFDYVTVSDDFEGKDYGDGPFNTYEEAEQACLDKLIEICKN
jgi:predicted GNAT superfamily acetyltransferase